MKILKKNACSNELLKGKTAAKNSYFEFIFTALAIILTVIRNLRLIKQSFSKDYAEVNCVSDENKHLRTNQKELKKRNNSLMMKSHCYLMKSWLLNCLINYVCINEERVVKMCKMKRDSDVSRTSRFAWWLSCHHFIRRNKKSSICCFEFDWV